MTIKFLYAGRAGPDSDDQGWTVTIRAGQWTVPTRAGPGGAEQGRTGMSKWAGIGSDDGGRTWGWAGQGRTGPDSDEQGRTGMGRAGSNSTGVSWAGQRQTGPDGAKQGRTGPSKAR